MTHSVYISGNHKQKKASAQPPKIRNLPFVMGLELTTIHFSC